MIDRVTPVALPITCGAIGTALGVLIGTCTPYQMYVLYGGATLGCIAGWILCIRNVTQPVETINILASIGAEKESIPT
jgi:hypothetical protein